MKMQSKWNWPTVKELGGTDRPAVKAGPFGSALKKEFYVDSGFRIYGQEQVIAGDLGIGDYYIDSARFNSLKACEVQAGDILVSLVGTFGKILVVPNEFEAGIINPRLVRLSLDPRRVDSKYFSHFFQSPIAELQMQQKSHGGTMGILNAKNIAALKIPLPSLSEQKRIAGILDEADALRVKRREAISQLDALLQSTFLTLFGDPVTNPMGWPQKRLGDLGEIITGNTPSRKQPEYYGNEIEWIKSDNINNPSFVLTKAEEYLSAEGEKVARMAPKGSVLVTCIAGSPACIGNAAMADRKVAFNQQINAFIPRNSLTQQYVFGMFLVGKRIIQNASTNSMKGMVNKSAFSAISVPLAPLELQKKFTTIFKFIEKQKAQQRTHLAELDTLFASLQSRAFKGEL